MMCCKCLYGQKVGVLYKNYMDNTKKMHTIIFKNTAQADKISKCTNTGSQQN
jgi:hypothetical protein